MGRIEDELRATFRSAVAVTPAVDDAAGRSINQAHRVRRRRVAVGAVATAVIVVVGGTTAVTLAGDGGGDKGVGVGGGGSMVTLLPPPLRPPPVDVLAGRWIVTTDGRTVPLAAAVPKVRQAFQVSTFWLMVADRPADGGATVWRVDADGRARQLVEGAQVAVSPGGDQVAWRDGTTLTVAAPTPQGMTQQAQTTVDSGFGPVAFIPDGLLLGRIPAGGGGIDSYDLWFPGRGKYTPGPRRTERVFGPTADGTGLYGLTGGRGPCLAELDPASFAVRRSACAPGLGPDDRIYPSPDGHWLLTAHPDGLDLYDLTTFWTDPTPTRSWPNATTSAQWLDAQTFVVGGQTGEVIMHSVADRGVEETIVLGSEPVQVITRAPTR